MPADDARRRMRSGSFFGRRKGHKLRTHQPDLIEQLLPRLALDIGGSAAPADLTELFDRPVDDVRLEIGFGGGEHLIAEALAFPDIGFIGCEPYVNGMAKILAQIEAHNIGNIRLFAGDAAELLAWAPPHSLARIDLIHPDPWPKRRHWKRRFVQDATVAAMARIAQAARRVSLRQRHRRLLRLDAGASVALARFRLDRGARRRLAPALARLHHDALRPQGRARRPRRRRIDRFRKISWRLRADHCRYADWRVCQNSTTRSAVDGIRRVKFTRALSISAGDATRLGPSRSRISARTVAHSRPSVLPRIRIGSWRSPEIRRSSVCDLHARHRRQRGDRFLVFVGSWQSRAARLR